MKLINRACAGIVAVKIALVLVLISQFGCEFSLGDLMTTQVHRNEIIIPSRIFGLYGWQIQHLKETGRYGSLNNLQGEDTEDGKQRLNGYLFEIENDDQSFQIRAVPLEYGKTGRLSYYMNNEEVSLHGANHQGKPATKDDPILNSLPEEIQEFRKTTLRDLHR